MESLLAVFVEHQSGVASTARTSHRKARCNRRAAAMSASLIGGCAPPGSVLSSMAMHYRYSRDIAWLKANQSEHFGRLGLDSEKPRDDPHACGRRHEGGALPGPVAQGRVHDMAGATISLLFLDGYTVEGDGRHGHRFSRSRTPRGRTGLSSGEADEYRQCIVDTMHVCRHLNDSRYWPAFVLPITVLLSANGRTRRGLVD